MVIFHPGLYHWKENNISERGSRFKRLFFFICFLLEYLLNIYRTFSILLQSTTDNGKVQIREKRL